jgi:hypothetical protein
MLYPLSYGGGWLGFQAFLCISFLWRGDNCGATRWASRHGIHKDRVHRVGKPALVPRHCMPVDSESQSRVRVAQPFGYGP